MHWGKVAKFNFFKLQKMYGTDMEKWIAARNKLLPATSLAVFNSPALHEWGLDKVSTPLRPF